MAEATALRSNALDVPIYGLPYTLAFPILDADGDLVTGATTPDSEVSKNGDSFADCTNEATEIASSSGMYYLTLTSTEMTADVVAVIVKCATTGAKTTPFVLYPRKLAIALDASNVGYNSGTTIYLGASANAADDFYNGCLVHIYGGTGSDQARVITDYVGSTGLATVHVAWATNPDNTSDVRVYRTGENPTTAAATGGVNVTQWNGSAVASPNSAGYPIVDIHAGTGTGQVSLSSGEVTPTAASKTGYRLSATGVDDILDEVIEGALTFRQGVRLFISALFGKVSGGGTSTVVFRDYGDTKARITATVDANGNRTAVTTDGT